MATGTRGRQGGNRGGSQGSQGNQGKGIPTGTANDGRGQVKNPETDGRIGNNTNPGNKNNVPQPRQDDLQQTLGQQGQGGDGQAAPQQPAPQPAAQQPAPQQAQAAPPEDQTDDPRMFAASKIMENAIQMLAVAGRMFKELDREAGVVADGSNDNVEYAQGCYDGLQAAIGEAMQALDEERGSPA